ncbi:MAG: hypothetical protein M1530_02640 [Candidatus Marsarchaeota archaeon]|nr:hypothetical protein [Candidatus Marsarchaeota archaeon]
MYLHTPLVQVMPMDIPNFYESPHFRRLILVPATLALISLILVLFVSPIRLGIDFRGGIDVTIQSAGMADTARLQSALKGAGFEVDAISSKPNPGGYVTQIELERSPLLVKADALKAEFYTLLDAAANDEADIYSTNDSVARTAYAASLQAMNAKADEIFNLSGRAERAGSFNTTSQVQRAVVLALSDLSSREQGRLESVIRTETPAGSDASFEEVTASLSGKFLDTALMVVFFAVLLTTAVVFVIFRTVTPSLAVLTGSVSDVIFALGAMSIFGIPLTLASFSALLMLVGFSLDTDVLLSMRVLKQREGTPAQRAYSAMKTGVTMSMSAMVAFGALFVLAMVTHIPIYYEISAVVLAGLFGDLFATWLFNAVIVLHYVEDQQKKGRPINDKPLLSYFFKN